MQDSQDTKEVTLDQQPEQQQSAENEAPQAPEVAQEATTPTDDKTDGEVTASTPTPQPHRPTPRLYVSGIPITTTHAEITQKIASIGGTLSHINMKTYQSVFTGAAHIVFSTPQEATDALIAINAQQAELGWKAEYSYPPSHKHLHHHQHRFNNRPPHSGIFHPNQHHQTNALQHQRRQFTPSNVPNNGVMTRPQQQPQHQQRTFHPQNPNNGAPRPHNPSFTPLPHPRTYFPQHHHQSPQPQPQQPQTDTAVAAPEGKDVAPQQPQPPAPFQQQPYRHFPHGSGYAPAYSVDNRNYRNNGNFAPHQQQYRPYHNNGQHHNNRHVHHQQRRHHTTIWYPPTDQQPATPAQVPQQQEVAPQ